MSNHKHAYGWLGHIIACVYHTESVKSDNLVAVKQSVFARLVSDHENCTTDSRIHTEQLGVTGSEYVYFIACGTGFTDGFQNYGTVFRIAESREETEAKDRAYHAAMLEVYGINLPKSKLMIGCSSEH